MVTTGKLKVWGGITYSLLSSSRGARCIVAATSLKKASELLAKAGHRESVYSMRGYWSKTYNALELQTATEPGVWVDVGDQGRPVYQRVV